MTRLRSTLCALLFLAVVPAVAVAQQLPAGPRAPTAEQQQQFQELLGQLRELDEQLEAIRSKAMEDQQLQSAQESLGEEIKAAMEKQDPELPHTLERIETLQMEAATAQQAGDAAKLEQLAKEAQVIQMRFVEARTKVLEQPELAEKIESFQTQLEARMVQLDPSAPELMKRFHELENRLVTVFGRNGS